MKRILLMSVILAAILLTACAAPVTTPTPYADDIEAVNNTITANLKEGLDYQAGSLQGGTAVLIADTGAYWVKDGVVYAANGTAKTWSPNISYAPVGIDFDSVKEACRD